MQNDILITELYKFLKHPSQTNDLDIFKKYNLSTDSIFKLKELNQLIHPQAANIQELQLNLGKKQLQMQYQQLDQLSKSGSQTFEVIKSLKDSLQHSLDESKNSQNITRVMYVVSFCLGLCLIIAALIFGMYGKAILAVAFGGFGMASIITHFIADPPARLQESRSNYVQLIGLTLAWFKETVNNDTYIASTGHITKEMLENYTVLASSYVANTGKFFKMMDDLAEPQNKKSKNDSEPAEQTN